MKSFSDFFVPTFKIQFLRCGYIIVIAFTTMFITQQQLEQDAVCANNCNEPNVSRSMYLSTLELKHPDNRQESPFPGLKFYRQIQKMKTPECISLFTWVRYQEIFENGKMTDIPYRATDHIYWKVMNFTFLEGKPYTQEEVDNKKPLVVLSESSRKRYFGNLTQVTGKQVQIEKNLYTVCGVVKDVPYSSPYAFGEYWIPYTVWDNSDNLTGLYIIQFVAHRRSDFAAIHTEYRQLLNQINQEIAPELTITGSNFGTRDYNYYASEKNAEKYTLSGKDILKSYLSTIWLLLVPLLALICLNFARANERSKEFAIRRIVGANKMSISKELLKDNLIVILLGMIPGLLLAYMSIHLHPDMYIGMDVREFTVPICLPFTWRLLSHLLLAALLFLTISIAIPVWRTSRHSIVKLLKGEDL